jgi:hypothetical protein
MAIDTFGQFAKLCPSYARNIDMTKEQQLDLVEAYLATERRLSNPDGRPHWAYDINRALALIELRDALKAETQALEEVAA